MGVRAVGLGLFLAVASPALAGTGARFTLGLGAEYLSIRDTTEGSRAEQTSFQPALSLDADGQILDARFLAFNGRLLVTGFDFKQAGEGTTTTRQLSYGLGIRALSNRPVSVELSASRTDRNVEGPAAAALTGGVDETLGGAVALHLKGWPEIRLSQSRRSFVADDPASLRDERRDTTELTGNYSRGILASDLLLRRERSDSFGNLIRQDLDTGNLTVELNRGGRDSFLTRLLANRFSFGAEGLPESPASTAYNWQNRYRHLIGARGSLEIFYLGQSSRSGGAPSLGSQQPGAFLVLPVSRFTQVEAQGSYLISDLDAGQQLTQPAGSLGLRYGREWRGFSLTLAPGANYVAVSRPGVPTESSWGGRFYGAVRGSFSRASAGLEGEYTGNQLSIAPAEPGDPLAGRSFISGLDKNRRLLRLSLQARPSWWAGLSGTGEYSRRTRVDRGAEVAEESRRAQADLTLGPFRLSGSTSEVEVTGGEIPSSSRFNYAALYITPAYWLQMDALVQDEKRTAVGVSGRFRYAEAGIRLRYARLSAYARVRQEETGENGSTGRKNRRIWAGLSRTFGFRVGANR